MKPGRDKTLKKITHTNKFKKGVCSVKMNRKMKKISITSYIGTEENVKIPNAIYNKETGEVVGIISKIDDNAFAYPELKAGPAFFGWTNEQYITDETMTVAVVYNKITGETYTGTEPAGDSYDFADKNEVMLSVMGAVGIEESDLVWNKITVNNEEYNMPYVYTVNGYEPVKKPTSIKSVAITSYVDKVGEKAFANQTAMTKMTYYGNQIPTISTNAFEGCTNLIEIRFPIWDYTQNQIDGQDTFWGAPNLDIKLYDKNGEV